MKFIREFTDESGAKNAIYEINPTLVCNKGVHTTGRMALVVNTWNKRTNPG